MVSPRGSGHAAAGCQLDDQYDHRSYKQQPQPGPDRVRADQAEYPSNQQDGENEPQHRVTSELRALPLTSWVRQEVIRLSTIYKILYVVDLNGANCTSPPSRGRLALSERLIKPPFLCTGHVC